MSLTGYYDSGVAVASGYSIWKTPDGKEVHCTEVCTEKHPLPMGRKAVKVGPVTDFIGKVNGISAPTLHWDQSTPRFQNF